MEFKEINIHTWIAGSWKCPFKKTKTKTNYFTHHVRHVNEGVIDGNDFDFFLKASPQDQTANATKAVREDRY